MIVKKILFTLFVFLFFQVKAQEKMEEQYPPYHIKTVAFIQNNTIVYPFFRLGESFSLIFDDLHADEEDYYYTITHCNYDWTPSVLAKPEYLNGLDNQRIIQYENSYNTLQPYSNYTLNFPNRFNTITKSGNYILKIFNDEEVLIFSKKFILYEDILSVNLNTRRPRDIENLNTKQNIEIAINFQGLYLQDPINNTKIKVMQNGNIHQPLENIKPQYTIGSELIYRYNNETQFWAGNEFYTFDTSNIRIINNSVAQVTSGDIYNSILYTNTPRKNTIYTFFPDFNGLFVITNTGNAIQNPNTESDYSWVYFSLDASNLSNNSSIYVNGLFNNYSLNDMYKMDYNKDNKKFEKALLLKQGYYNYQYVLSDAKNKILYKNAIDGNFYLTENQYDIFVYYKGNNERYDRVIGKARNNSQNIRD